MSYPDVYPDLYPSDAIAPPFPELKNKIEWYTLDNSLRKAHVIEGFESFIWTERYSSIGDFQIVTKSTFENRTLLAPKTRITMAGSTYVMTVETVSDDTADDGKRNITVTGSSMEALLDDRVAMPAIGDLAETPVWTLTGTPGDIIRQMFHEICVFTVLDPLDTIPFYTDGTLLPSGNLGESADIITVSAAPDTLYNTIKKIADTYSMGFRLVRNGELGQIYFEVYTGNDLSSGQDTLPAVIFDPGMDNLGNVSFLTSTAIEKTVAYVFAANGAVKVFAPTASTSASGSDRKILFVNSSNSDAPGPDLDAALRQEGLIALSAQRTVYSFDGELPQNIPYEYGVDYNLGDLVEERNSASFGNLMIVTEQIFVSDSTGDRAYPTLSLNQGITPGSWTAWDGAEEWADVDISINWNEV